MSAATSPTGVRGPNDRRSRRAALLRELAEARALRERVAPSRTRLTRARAALHMRSYRY